MGSTYQHGHAERWPATIAVANSLKQHAVGNTAPNPTQNPVPAHAFIVQ